MFDRKICFIITCQNWQFCKIRFIGLFAYIFDCDIDECHRRLTHSPLEGYVVCIEHKCSDIDPKVSIREQLTTDEDTVQRGSSK